MPFQIFLIDDILSPEYTKKYPRKNEVEAGCSLLANHRHDRDGLLRRHIKVVAVSSAGLYNSAGINTIGQTLLVRIY